MICFCCLRGILPQQLNYLSVLFSLIVLETLFVSRSSSGHGRSSLAHGTLVITNTMEDFKMADKSRLITESGRKVCHAE